MLFLVSMTLILVTVSLLFYDRSSEDYQNKVSDLSKKNSSQTVALFDLLLKGYDSLSKSLSNNMDVVRILSQKETSPAVDYFNERSITNVIGAIYYSRDDLMGIHVISFGGKVVSFGDYANVVDTMYRDADWFKEIQDSSGRMEWLGVFPQSVIDTSLKKQVFAFGRLIYDLDQYKPIGIVLVEAKPQLILSAMDNLKLGPHGDAYIFTESDKVIASSSDAPLLTEESRAAIAASGEGVYSSGDELIVTSKITVADWTIASKTPVADLNVELVRTKRYLVVVFAILVFISILIAIWGSRTLSFPLKRVIREMRKVEAGDFDRVLSIHSYREIDQLVVSFNHMVWRIAGLIEQVKISSVSEKNAEIQALQSQVNPHFLYNTLDMIYWLLDEKGNDKLADVVLSLSHMFRYSSHWENEATIGQEVEQIRHYLTIIETRLEGRLAVDIDIDERWLDFRVPKMTLQPVIENAVKHGLEPVGSQGKLGVSAIQEGDSLTITVSDNGIGMNENQLAELRKSLEIPRTSERGGDTLELVTHREGGIGMTNLQRRLRLMFGENYGITVESAPLKGTSVRIRLQLPEKVEVRNEYTGS